MCDCNGHGAYIITQRTRNNIWYKYIIQMEATVLSGETFLRRSTDYNNVYNNVNNPYTLSSEHRTPA